MNVLTLINVATNSIIGTSIMLFIISVFGRADHPIWEHKYRAYLAKIGLGITGCGAIAAVLLSLSNPPEADILFKVAIFQHIGLTLNFCWLSWWQYAEYKKQKRLAFPPPLAKPSMKVGPKILNKKLAKKVLP
jgi:hypothetical protein